jgi:hypothetical protein
VGVGERGTALERALEPVDVQQVQPDADDHARAGPSSTRR